MSAVDGGKRTSPIWVHPLIWLLVSGVIGWAAFVHFITFAPQIEKEEGTTLIMDLQDKFLLESGLITLSTDDYEEFAEALGLTGDDTDTYTDTDTEAGTGEDTGTDDAASPASTTTTTTTTTETETEETETEEAGPGDGGGGPGAGGPGAKRKLMQPGGMEMEEVTEIPDLYRLVSPGDAVLNWWYLNLAYFVIGLAGWMCFYLLQAPAALWGPNNKIRSFFGRPALPFKWWAGWVNLCRGEVLVFSALILVPSIMYSWNTISEAKTTYDEGGMISAEGIEDPTAAQYWVDTISILCAELTWVMWPGVFAFASRTSLLNQYLGVKFGTMLKWHKFLGGLLAFLMMMHGLLFQSMWLNVSWQTWKDEVLVYEYSGVSVLSGFIAWWGALLLGLFSWSAWFRRKFYLIWYRLHIIGAATVAVFGCMHDISMWYYMSAGLVVYGVNLAYRLFQTTMPVHVDVGSDPESNVMAIRIPVKDGEEYQDGCHVWICIPQISWIEYHPFSVTSSPLVPGWRNTILLQPKIQSKWTKKLAMKAREGGLDNVSAKIQGPYDGQNMAPCEIDAFTRKVFISGGVGIASVLPMLQRIALHKAQDGLSQDMNDKIVVVHSARTPAEVMLAAPLLKHTAVLDIHLHYTGKAPLAPAQKALAAPLSPTSSGKGDVENGLKKGGEGSRMLLDMLPGKWESLFVWTLTFFCSFWIHNMPDLWYNSKEVQAGTLSQDEETDRSTTQMSWTILAVALTAPTAPLVLVILWRLGKFIVEKLIAPKRRPIERDQTSVVQPDVWINNASAEINSDHRPEVASLDVKDTAATLSLHGFPTAQVEVRTGRPDVKNLIQDVEAIRMSGAMGVWSAGPTVLNTMVYEATSRLRGDVRYFPLAYEL